MEKYILSITDLAKLKNITSETLRHYDRIGLLKPVEVIKGGRRMYSIRQYEKLGTILELKEMGMSLKEIQEYMNNRNVKKSTEILERYQQRLEAKVRELEDINETLKQKIEFLHSLEELPQEEEIFEENFPVRYAVSFGERAGDREEHALAFVRLENHIKEKIPVIASDRVGVFSDERILHTSSSLIPAIPMMLVSRENGEKEFLKRIPEGKYVCMYYRNGTLEKYDPSFEKLKKYLYEKKYQINGMILQFYKIDVTLTSDRWETLLEIQVPVK